MTKLFLSSRFLALLIIGSLTGVCSSAKAFEIHTGLPTSGQAVNNKEEGGILHWQADIDPVTGLYSGISNVKEINTLDNNYKTLWSTLYHPVNGEYFDGNANTDSQIVYYDDWSAFAPSSGTISIANNSLSRFDTSTNNEATFTRGGAIGGSGTIIISDANYKLSFDGNSVENGNSNPQNATAAWGGALCAGTFTYDTYTGSITGGRSGGLELIGNKDISFTNNFTMATESSPGNSVGGAIAAVSLTIANNDGNVYFHGNSGRYGTSSQNGDDFSWTENVDMRTSSSVFVSNNAVFSAKNDKLIYFGDAVYVGGTTTLNKYDNAVTNGAVIFGKASGTSADGQSSLDVVHRFEGKVSLEGGSMHIIEGATVQITSTGLFVAAAGTTLKIDGGSQLEVMTGVSQIKGNVVCAASSSSQIIGQGTSALSVNMSGMFTGTGTVDFSSSTGLEFNFGSFTQQSSLGLLEGVTSIDFVLFDLDNATTVGWDSAYGSIGSLSFADSVKWDDFLLTLDKESYENFATTGTITYNVTSIPEPSTTALGLIALSLLLTRRRRRLS